MNLVKAKIIAILSNSTLCVQMLEHKNKFLVVGARGLESQRNLLFHNGDLHNDPDVRLYRKIRKYYSFKYSMISMEGVTNEAENFNVPILGDLDYIATSIFLINEKEELIDFVELHKSILLDTRKEEDISDFTGSDSIDTLLSHVTEFDAIVLNFDSDCVVTLFLLDYFITLDIEIAGLYLVEFNQVVREFISELVLNEKVRVKILRNRRNRLYLGTFIVNNHDITYYILTKGYGLVNDITLNCRSDSKLMNKYENDAMKQMLGFWKNINFNKENMSVFRGKIIEILSGNVLRIEDRLSKNNITISLAYTLSREYDIESDENSDESYSALIFLATNFSRKDVVVRILGSSDKNHCALVHCGNTCLNELLIKYGLVKYHPALFLPKPEFVIANDGEKSSYLKKNPKLLCNDAVYKFLDTKGSGPLTGIVTKILSPNLHYIDFIEDGYRVLLRVKGIKTYSYYHKMYDLITEHLNRNVLYKNVRIEDYMASGGCLIGRYSVLVNTTSIIPDISLFVSSFEEQVKSMVPKQIGFDIEEQSVDSVIPVRITSFESPNIVSLQKESFTPIMSKRGKSSKNKSFKKGEYCLLHRNRESYRIFIRKSDDFIYCSLLDYGINIRAFNFEISSLPKNLWHNQCSFIARLSFIKPFEGKNDLLLNYLRNSIDENMIFHAHILDIEKYHQVLLTFDADNNRVYSLQNIILFKKLADVKESDVNNIKYTKVLELVFPKS